MRPLAASVKPPSSSRRQVSHDPTIHRRLPYPTASIASSDRGRRSGRRARLRGYKTVRHPAEASRACGRASLRAPASPSMAAFSKRVSSPWPTPLIAWLCMRRRFGLLCRRHPWDGIRMGTQPRVGDSHHSPVGAISADSRGPAVQARAIQNDPP